MFLRKGKLLSQTVAFYEGRQRQLLYLHPPTSTSNTNRVDSASVVHPIAGPDGRLQVYLWHYPPSLHTIGPKVHIGDHRQLIDNTVEVKFKLCNRTVNDVHT